MDVARLNEKLKKSANVLHAFKNPSDYSRCLVDELTLF